jgi:hypothetical protein
MAAKLNLTIMVHIEDVFLYSGVETRQPPYSQDTGDLAQQYALLATRVANETGAHGQPRGARMSWQYDVNYFKIWDENGKYPDTGNTSLSVILDAGHNWWCQNHSSTFDHLQTTWARVASAYWRESGGADPTAHVIGRSGGWGAEGAPVDWASIAVHKGLKAMNALVQVAHTYTPQSLRPMQYTDEEIWRLHHHERAPGTTCEEVPSTMQQRPFWVDSASRFDLKCDSIYPEYGGSILAIPAPPTFNELQNMAEGRSAYQTDDLTTADLDAALTHIFTTAAVMDTYLTSINNVWYTHLRPEYCTTPYHDDVCAWVDSINEIMGVFGGSPRAQWRNMNEITSLAYHPTSRYY